MAGADARFLESLDYVGLDFFPDVFRPIAAAQLAAAVTAVLTGFWRTDLPKAGIPDTVPIRIRENGWPTGPDRPEQRQSAVLETVVRTVATLAAGLYIDGYGPPRPYCQLPDGAWR
ncbi:hypothetical protein [Streptomyces sp. NPDC088760]|uniref:hypothetical protein n=1 Tax=Streptomyces sp. NPDC088760 TaxID=3365890 RepID=UPI003809CE44